MALVAERAGQVDIRVGGNTQDYAVEVKNLPDNQAIMKYQVDSSNPTQTPTLLFTPEIIYMLANVSALVNAKWYLGIPFNDTTNPRLEIAQTGQSILGENLLGLQLGNEPDLYAAHGHRPSTYSPWDYFDEFSVVVDAISNDSQIPVRNNLIAPSVSGTWTPEDIWNTGFIPTFMNELGALAVEHYPADNCAAQYPNQGFGTPIDPQMVFANYLNHTSGQSIVAPYLNSTAIAQASGKPFLMLETNTASCGGFPGVSDSFGAALWSIDYALQMAYANFSGANLHVGGRDDSYNPFTPPPSNMTNFEQWTIGPIFYSVLAVAEALGSSNTSRILDLNANGANIYTPAYAIYEQGTIARVALFNYITDPSGASTYTATISVSDTNEQNTTPPQVRVKYLLAESVSVKDNITWAGQVSAAVTNVAPNLMDELCASIRHSVTGTQQMAVCKGARTSRPSPATKARTPVWSKFPHPGLRSFSCRTRLSRTPFLLALRHSPRQPRRIRSKRRPSIPLYSLLRTDRTAWAERRENSAVQARGATGRSGQRVSSPLLLR
ncbi:hypothetical protein AcW1_002338 [Taiwanofungus camphoratus]|nr:hypothetical protein AcW1_002338 [Antrodia cinnamomea]